MVLKNTLSDVSKWKPLWVINIYHLLRKIDARLFFFNHHLKSAFLNMGLIKHQQKLVYDIYEFLKQKIVIKDKK